MGMAASQARFLELTARASDIEYEAQQISQQRLAINDQMNIFSDEYDEATSNKVIIARVNNNGMNENVTLTYNVITGDPMNGGMGMRLMSSSGLIIVASEEERDNQIKLYNESHPDASDEFKLSELNFMVLEDVKDVDYLQDNLNEGNFYLTGDANRDQETGEWRQLSVEQCDFTTSVYDTSDDAAAKALYEKRMKNAERQDSMLEMRLDQLNTEHKAIETEMEALQKVIDDDVESSYKTFG